ncbi:hypothetical protein M0802_010287 [Mischocyttarus mexicanus]|nr:hypothetical protein M0802_010287 [Mischocyttarus mexicanus]
MVSGMVNSVVRFPVTEEEFQKEEVEKEEVEKGRRGIVRDTGWRYWLRKVQAQLGYRFEISAAAAAAAAAAADIDPNES